MTTFYLDPANGNDDNDGSTWALAWKTIRLGALTARIAPGDVIRIAKTPDPTSIGSATWNNLSKTLTLASALTADVDLCETIWTVSTYITVVAYSTSRKEGTYCNRFTVGASFTTGKMAYKTLTSTDFSGYQQLSFWFFSSTIAAADTYKVCLCSDTTGDTIVDTFSVPAALAANTWFPVTVDKGSALGSSIQSVAIYANSDPGTPYVHLDNIIACKASSSADALSLTSLVSKNSLATGGTEGWYPIQSINGTTVLLDNAPTSLANTGRGYYGTTETVTTYRRETVAFPATTSGQVQDSGTSGNLIEFQGGYDTATTTQDGETFFDGRCGSGNGLEINTKTYIKINRISVARCAMGLYLLSSSYCDITMHTLCGNASNNLYNNASMLNKITVANVLNSGSVNFLAGGSNNYGNEFTLGNVNNSLSIGVSLTGFLNNKLTIGSVCNNAGACITFGNNYCFGNRIQVSECKNSTTYALDFNVHASDNIVTGMTTSGNGSGALSTVYGNRNYLRGCTLGETTKLGYSSAFYNGRVFSDKQDGSLNNNYTYTDGGVIFSQTSVRNTASGIAWQLSPTSTNRSEAYPLDMQIARVAVASGSQVTVTCYFRRSNTGITGRLICKGYQIAGVDSDVYDDISVAADTWEQLSIQFTPTEAGVVEILALAWGGTTYSVYVDDLEVSQ